ncbi:MAG TPA: hypothetical protein ENJ30_02015 [Desulfobulbaceae bacterium]|nr:hypothetical protein [Desulfobulbaceae bacterium]
MGWFWILYLIAYFTVAWLLLAPSQADARAKHKHYEKWYQRQWCEQQGGKTEYVLPDRTRCDCLTATHAIEFDFGPKWAEAIGQSLYYSLQTGKRAGIVLILEQPGDMRYWIRLNSVIMEDQLDIDTWRIGPGL